jgi:hypothetical protein
VHVTSGGAILCALLLQCRYMLQLHTHHAKRSRTPPLISMRPCSFKRLFKWSKGAAFHPWCISAGCPGLYCFRGQSGKQQLSTIFVATKQNTICCILQLAELWKTRAEGRHQARNGEVISLCFHDPRVQCTVVYLKRDLIYNTVIHTCTMLFGGFEHGFSLSINAGLRPYSLARTQGIEAALMLLSV